jgi:predicted acylesterase/phospholipase RssA/CRP-like cAMP-binding protein
LNVCEDDSATEGSSYPSDQGPNDSVTLLRRQRLASSLEAVFGTADAAIIDDLLRLGEWVKLFSGDRLFSEGDPGDSVYIVVAGRLRALAEDAGRRRVLGEIRPGESVGEMGLLAGHPRTATVEALRDSLVVRISDKAFQEVVATHPQFITTLSRLVIRRMTETIRGHKPRPKVKSVAVLPIGSDARYQGFATRLQRALEISRSVLRIDRPYVDALLSANGISSSSTDDARNLVLSSWTDEQELRHEVLLYEADGPTTPWTRQCIRQADAVLLLAPADASPSVLPELAPLPAGDAGGRRCELVLIHPPGTRQPRGTAGWLEGREIERQHHLRWDRDDDFRRLARFLTGEAVGVVFGGGGARAFAHLGVIRALRESRIPIDAVGGTSQGAIVAAGLALDWDDAAMERHHRDGFTERNPTGDYALIPHLSLVKGRRLEAALRRAFGEQDIEDAWRSFFCVSTNLTRAQMAVHRRGKLWKALRASVSVPGIFPPVVYEEDLYVDGAILDNLPIETMRESGVGRIVAVSVVVNKELRMQRGELPSVLQFLKGRLRNSEQQGSAPELGSILVRSILIPGMQRSAEMLAGVDLYLNPEPAEIGFFEWNALDRGIELGYRYAKQQLARLNVAPLAERRDASEEQAPKVSKLP